MSEIKSVLDQYTQLIQRGELKNLSPMLPLLFTLRGKPFSLKDHFIWEPLFNINVPKTRTLVCGRQVAKCLQESTRLLKSNGDPVTIKDIEVGDVVSCLDDTSLVSSSGIVTNKWYTGSKKTLRIEMASGGVHIVTPEHKFRTLYGYTEAGSLEVGSRAARMVKSGEFKDVYKDQYRIIVLAYMLGDGGTTGTNPIFVSAEQSTSKEFIDIATEVDEVAPVNRPRYYEKTGVTTDHIYLSTKSELTGWLREDGLLGKYSYEKTIPEWVFNLSLEQTILFLSRLWSTDGSIKQYEKRTEITYCSTSKVMIDQIQSLLLKLGIPSSVTAKMGQYNGIFTRMAYNIRVETREGKNKFQKLIIVPGKPAIPTPTSAENNNRYTVPIEIHETLKVLASPIKSSRCKGKHRSLRSASLRVKPKYPLSKAKLQRYIDYFSSVNEVNETPDYNLLLALRDGDVSWDRVKSIQEYGKQETYDIEVESTNNFVLAGGVVTHNSETTAVQMLSWQLMRDYMNILYVAPRDTQATIFSNDKIGPYIKNSPVFRDRDPNLPNGVRTRSIREGSNMYFSYAFLDAERIRSITAGAIFYDEAQDLNPAFRIPIGQVLAASLDFGVTQSTGTPKTFDNNLETQWSKSSQAQWCIPCHNCMKLNVSGAEFDLLKMIQPQGLSCAKCGKLIDTRCGWWEHRYPNRRLRHEGYHGPQPIFPMHCEKQPDEVNAKVGRKWQEILYQQEEMPTYGFYNEILGESYDNADELISKSALVENSTMDHDNTLEAAIKLARDRRKYNFITMGVDWGGGGESGLSRTAVAVLGWKGSAKPDVIYMNRVTNPMPTDQEALYIKQLAAKFGIDILADDYCGAGEAKEIILLQTGFPYNKLMPISYVPSTVGKMMEYVPAEDTVSRPYIKAARTKSLTIMAALINNGYYTFPRFESWDAHGYPNNLLSLIQEKRDRAGGAANYFITHKAGRADDLAHAINYASIGYWYVTGNTPDFTKLLGREFVDD